LTQGEHPCYNPGEKEGSIVGSYAYDKENTRQLRIKLNRKTDADIIEHIEKQANIQSFVKALIRADIEKEEQKKC
jgi:hypothetical protein